MAQATGGSETESLPCRKWRSCESPSRRIHSSPCSFGLFHSPPSWVFSHLLTKKGLGWEKAGLTAHAVRTAKLCHIMQGYRQRGNGCQTGRARVRCRQWGVETSGQGLTRPHVTHPPPLPSGTAPDTGRGLAAVGRSARGVVIKMELMSQPFHHWLTSMRCAVQQLYAVHNNHLGSLGTHRETGEKKAREKGDHRVREGRRGGRH